MQGMVGWLLPNTRFKAVCAGLVIPIFKHMELHSSYTKVKKIPSAPSQNRTYAALNPCPPFPEMNHNWTFISLSWIQNPSITEPESNP